LRLLPVIGGLVVGAGLADRVARLAGAKITVAVGFAILAIGLAAGASTTVTSGDGFLVAWTFVAGVGMGFALATAADSALGTLPAERSGVGSAVMQTVQKIGGPFGAAILGAALNSTYRAHLSLTGLPASAAAAVQQSVFAGIAVAQKAGSAQLLESVRAAFVDGMDQALWISAGFAVAGIVLGLAFLPRRAPAKAAATSHQVARRERERVLLGILLALVAEEARREDADPRLVGGLSSFADGSLPRGWTEAERGRAVARDTVEPLALALLASSPSTPTARRTSESR
ncbi:MAG TPA: hypothetical protein VF770_07805, partial [Solirubrobacterales bacterium]